MSSSQILLGAQAGPSLILNFMGGALNSRITFARSSAGRYFNSSGTLVSASNDVARFDYEPVSKVIRGLLIEPARTNLATYSEDMSNATWSASGITGISTNAAVAPDGATTADQVNFNANDIFAYFLKPNYLTVINVGSSPSVVSFFVKNVTSSVTTATVISTRSQSGGTYYTSARFLLGPPTAPSASFSSGSNCGIIDVGNGWYRIWQVVTGVNSYAIEIKDNTGIIGTASLLFWGWQVEAGNSVSSYIPTTTGSVARSADVVSISGTNFTSWYSASQGSIYAEAMRPTLIDSSGTASLATFSDNTANERMTIFNNGTGQTVDTTVTDGGVAQATLSPSGAITANSVIKYGFAYSANSFAAVRNDGTVVTDASGTLPTVNRLYIGADATGGGQWNGWMRKIVYYPSRLPDSILKNTTK